MDKKLAARWVKALRSGRYKQCRLVAQNSEGHNCCLGVLGRIKRVKGIAGNGDISPLPNEIISPEMQALFSDMNDMGSYSFKEIADAIEAQVLGGNHAKA